MASNTFSSAARVVQHNPVSNAVVLGETPHTLTVKEALTLNESAEHNLHGLGSLITEGRAFDGEVTIVDGRAYHTDTDNNTTELDGDEVLYFAQMASVKCSTAEVDMAYKVTSRDPDSDEYHGRSMIERLINTRLFDGPTNGDLPASRTSYVVVLDGVFNDVVFRSVDGTNAEYTHLREIVAQQTEFKPESGHFRGFALFSGDELSAHDTIHGFHLHAIGDKGAGHVQRWSGFDGTVQLMQVVPENWFVSDKGTENGSDAVYRHAVRVGEEPDLKVVTPQSDLVVPTFV